MKFKFYALTVLALILSLTVAAVLADFFQTGGTSFGHGSVIVNGKIARVQDANGDIDVSVSMAGEIVGICQNNGGNIAPGQDPVSFDEGLQPVVPLPTVHLVEGVDFTGGSVEYTLHFNVIDAYGLTADVVGCPNGNWTVVDAISPNGVQITVTATDGTQVSSMTFQCIINEPFDVVACDPEGANP